MSGSLVKIAETTVTSAAEVSQVTLSGITTDFDIYMVKINKLEVVTNQRDIKIRFTESGTPNTTSNYDVGQRNLNAGQTFDTQTSQNQSSLDLSLNIGNDTGEQLNSIIYIYNAPNSSEFTSVTMENSMMSDQAELRGKQGGGTFTVASQVDGIQFLGNSTNIDNGVFTLYALRK